MQLPSFKSYASWHPVLCIIRHILCRYLKSLTQWGRYKVAAISQMTHSNALCRMKMFEFWLKFHWNMFLGVELTTIQHWFRCWFCCCVTLDSFFISHKPSLTPFNSLLCKTLSMIYCDIGDILLSLAEYIQRNEKRCPDYLHSFQSQGLSNQ